MSKQFDFGSNWADFSKQRIDRSRLEMACASMRALLGEGNLAGKSFLDVGCGSGLFSIAAHKLGAKRVVGIDVNPACIETSKTNRDLLTPGSPIEFYLASALDSDRLRGFGEFDMVYAWGSLHHTGAMWSAIANVAKCVGPEGILVLAIYNKHFTSPAWKAIKWTYNQMPQMVQRLMVVVLGRVIYVAKFLVTRNNPMKKERGMDFWFDVIDWVGGYPYEYARASDVISTVARLDFCVRLSVPASVPTGCNQFVFDKR